MGMFHTSGRRISDSLVGVSVNLKRKMHHLYSAPARPRLVLSLMTMSEMPLNVTMKLDATMSITLRLFSLIFERHGASHCLNWMVPARATSISEAYFYKGGSPAVYHLCRTILARHCKAPQRCSCRPSAHSFQQPLTSLRLRREIVDGRIVRECQATHDDSF